MSFLSATKTSSVAVNLSAVPNVAVNVSQAMQTQSTFATASRGAGQRRLRAGMVREPMLKAAPDELNEKLFIAAANGNLSVVKELIIAGASANARDKQTARPLIFSALEWPEVLQFLIDNGANINATFGRGLTPLHLAACSNAPESIHVLMKAGARVNEKDAKGFTPLVHAQGLLMKKI